VDTDRTNHTANADGYRTYVDANLPRRGTVSKDDRIHGRIYDLTRSDDGEVRQAKGVFTGYADGG